MVAQVDVFNMAVSRIGIGQTISDLEERTEPRRQCTRWFEFCRLEVLRNHPYAFARRAVQLAESADQTYPGYAFVYDYPNDCAQLLELIPEGGLRWQQGAILFCNWDEREMFRVPKISFERVMRTDGQAQAIATDLYDAYAVYTSSAPVIGMWPTDAVNALVWRLAAEIGGPLKADPRMVQMAWQQYEVMKLRSGGNDLNEGYPDPEPDGPSISARM